MLNGSSVGQNTVKADKAKDAKVWSKPLTGNVQRRRTNFADIKLFHVTKEDGFLSCRNAVHRLVYNHWIAQNGLWNASLLVAHLPKVIAVTVFQLSDRRQGAVIHHDSR